MTPATAAAMPVAAQPTPLPPPATIEDTGLHPDTLAQLLLKTLWQASGAAPICPRGYACRTRSSTRSFSTRAWRSCSRSAAPAAPAPPVTARADRPRSRPRRAVPRVSPLRWSGTRAARAVQRLRPRLHGRPALCRQGQAVDRVRAAGRQQGDARSARASGQFGQVAVPLRRARQREDGRGRGYRTRARRRDVRSARGGRRWQTITMFDPVNHHHLGGVAGGMDSVIAAGSHDRRWDGSSVQWWWSAASSRSRCSI